MKLVEKDFEFKILKISLNFNINLNTDENMKVNPCEEN